MSLQIQLLGPAHIQRDDEPVDLVGQRSLALLAYLLLTGKAHSRQHLTDLLFDSPSDPRAALRWNLSKLRSALGAAYLLADSEEISFNFAAGYWLDVAEFESGKLELYRGDLLEGLSVRNAYAFEDWLLFERERLRGVYQSGLEARLAEQQGRSDYRAALMTAQQLLRLDNLREDWQRALMSAYAGLGKREAALAQYEQCRHVLAAELGVEPVEETQALARAIRSGRLQPASLTTGAAVRPSPASGRTRLPPKSTQPHLFPTSLHGRTAELAALRDAWEQVRAGAGQIMLIEGEPGIGKTRLVEELLAGVADQASILRAKCPELQDPLAYTLFVDPLRDALAGERPPGVSDAWLAEVARLLPELRDCYPDLPQPVSLDPAAERRRLFDAACAVLLSLGGERPLILFLDDLQWADGASLELLTHLTDWLAEAPLFVLGAYRPHEVPSGHPLHTARHNWQRCGRLSGLVLVPLPDTPVRALLQELTTWQGIDTSFGDLIYRETAGNPLFVIETVASLRDAGRLPPSGNGAGWLRDFLSEEVPIPAGVQAVIQTRLDRLDEISRQVLSAGAVMRDAFEFEVVRAISGRSELETLGSLERLLAGGLLVEDGQNAFNFSHDKIREVAYRGLSQVRRRLLHRRVAESLEGRFRGREKAAAEHLGYHYEQGGVWDKAIHYHTLAGQAARERYAHDAAERHYRRALALLSAEMPNALETHVARCVEIYDGLADTLFCQGRYAEAAEAEAAMQAAAEESGDVTAQMRAWYGLCSAQYHAGDLHAALRSANRMEEIARTADPPAQFELARALFQKGWVSFHLGDVKAALSLGEQCVALLAELGPDTRSALAFSLHLPALAHLGSGHYVQARDYWEQALVILQEIGERPMQGGVLNNLGEVAREQGDYRVAMARYRAALSIAHEFGDRGDEMLLLGNIAAAQVGLGDYSSAEANLRRVIDMAGDPGWRALSETYCFLADALLGQDRTEEALPAARQALSLAQALESPNDIGRAWRALGNVAAQRSAPVVVADRRYAPADCFAESLRVFADSGADGERARTLRVWADYELAQGDRARGEALWREARELVERLGMRLEMDR